MIDIVLDCHFLYSLAIPLDPGAFSSYSECVFVSLFMGVCVHNIVYRIYDVTGI